MRFAIVNCRALVGDCFRDDVTIIVHGGRIESVAAMSSAPTDMEVVDLCGAMLLPGFIDIQVNGGGGVLFNDEPTPDAIARIGAAHRRFGTTGFLPTLISDDLDVIERGIAAVDAAITAGVPGVLGIHIEGPFLNAERKGTHDAAKLRMLDEDGFRIVTGLKHGRTLLTLAPECTTPAMIARLTRAGVIVAGGHTNADYATMRAAIGGGLSGVTHLFNAMSQLTTREPGVVGAALEDPDLWCGLIVDGVHVAPITMRLALRCKGSSERFLLVTDAMPCVGSEANHFYLQGRRVDVVDGVCINADGTLAGTDLDMARAVNNAARMLALPMADAVAMATVNPANFLGVGNDRGRLAPGHRADMASMREDGTVSRCWIGGVETAR